MREDSLQKISEKGLPTEDKCANIIEPYEGTTEYPGVAKFGIALEWGSRGRWFESSHSDHAECPYRI